MKKKNVLFSGVAALTLFLSACGSSDSNTDSAADTASSDNETVKIGVVSEVEVEVWEDVASRLEAKGIELEIVQFSDYVQPNVA
ncbi:MAG: MetQ/NlpA family ABC transporter substrate-binding protein, partial [Trichococcus flocculiformis]